MEPMTCSSAPAAHLEKFKEAKLTAWRRGAERTIVPVQQDAALDPPPRAARLGAASGVEGPGRAQRLKGASTTGRVTPNLGEEQPLSWIERRPPEP
jgi:hypothetical protein